MNGKGFLILRPADGPGWFTCMRQVAITMAKVVLTKIPAQGTEKQAVMFTNISPLRTEILQYSDW
jgi:hypothetical protein